MDVKLEKNDKKKLVGGRPNHEGWKLYHFEKVLGDKGKSEARCMKCHVQMKNTTINRFIVHRKKCGNLPINTITHNPAPVQIQIASPNTSTTTTTVQTPSNTNKIELDEFDASQILQNQSQILWADEQVNFGDENPNTIDIINEDIQRHRNSTQIKRSRSDADVALSSFLIGCNQSFDLVDSKYFKNFVNALNPDYKIPSSSQLKARVLSQLKGSGSEGGSGEKGRGKKRRYYSSDSDDD